jgi:uncharacterized protein YkwD
MRHRAPLIPLLAAMAATSLLAPAAASAGSAEGAMLRDINLARSAAGVPPVRRYEPLTRTSKRYAVRLARSGQMVHAANPARGAHARYVGEILGMTTTPGSAADAIVRAWLGSAIHRPILLDRRYRYVGIGLRHGGAGWVWVVRFGAR